MAHASSTYRAIFTCNHFNHEAWILGHRGRVCCRITLRAEALPRIRLGASDEGGGYYIRFASRLPDAVPPLNEVVAAGTVLPPAAY